ncbi:MAG: hypothetical protein APF76_12225 [Desulfitibacter sp. BRH_c19]|nr:MAG: hypothetical protein APF76_12225 [Desulfitibacter sp. BRH_c19]
MDWDVIIVGGGPSGCFTAKLIAELGFKVAILEEHENVGQPVQCAGLISPRVMELVGITENIIINSLTDLRVFSPLGSKLCISSSSNYACAIDRAAFDRCLAVKAEKAGANLLTGAKVYGLQRIAEGYRVSVLLNNTEMTMDTRLIVGADGSFSKVAKWLALKNTNPRAVMYAADVKLYCPDTSRIDIFLGRSLAPGWFGWVIPLDKNTCRVGSGYAIKRQNCSPQYYFKQMVNQYPQYFSGFKVLRYTGGSVPLGLMSKIYTQHAMLVGDAACQNKPISGGGIYLGLRGALLCAKVAIKALLEGDLSEERLSLYQVFWEKEMKDEIVCGMKHRESFMDMTDEDMDFIIKFSRQPIVKNIILKHGDIDYPSKLSHKLLSFKPWNKRFFKVAMKVAGYDKI